MLNVVAARAASASILTTPKIEAGRMSPAIDPRGGFLHIGEYLRAVAQVSKPNPAFDERLDMLAAAPSTFGSESNGADGGFAVPTAFARDVFTMSLLDDALLPFVDAVSVSGANSMHFPVDESAPWGNDGVQVYWQSEGFATTPAKPVLREGLLRFQKLIALVPLSDEITSDSATLATYLPRRLGDAIRWKLNEAILRGSGVGQPLGCMNSAAAVVASKDAGQATNTMTAANLANMIGRLPQGSFNRAVWLVNNEALAAILALDAPSCRLGPVPAGIPGSPCGTLMGRPVIVSQHAAAFSSQGDVMLVDLSRYRAILQSNATQTTMSMHLYFDVGLNAFRATFRVDGEPSIKAPITPVNGTNALSPFIQLAAR